MPVIADVAITSAGPADGAICNAWKASRFGSAPSLNSAPPSGSADAGPVTSGSTYGGLGHFRLTVPTDEDYYVSVAYGGNTAWAGPYPATENADIVHLSGAETISGVKTFSAAPKCWSVTLCDASGNVRSTLRSGTGAPTGGSSGDFYFQQDGAASNRLWFNASGTWSNAIDSGAGGGMTNPMTTLGDIITAATGGTAQRLGVGANGQVLTVVTGQPAWANASSGFTNPMSAAGDLIAGGSGGAATRLAIGTQGQVLTVNGGAPQWVNAATGFANPMTTTGDLILAGTGGAATRLPIGTSGQVLTVSGGTAAWVAAASTGGVHTNSASGSAATVDWSTGQMQRLVLTANCTITFANPVDGARYTLHLIQDATGSRTVTFPASVVWAGGTVPTLTTNAGYRDVVSLIWGNTSGKYLTTPTLNFAA